MKKWSANMLTGARNMTSKMRATGTCRPDADSPACRRGAPGGVWLVARFAVVAVMAVVFGLGGSVTSAMADTLDRLPTSDIAVGFNSTTEGTHYEAVDDPVGTPDDDATYVESNSNNEKDVFGFSSFSLPSTSTINSISVTYRARDINFGTSSNNAVIRVNGTDYNGTGNDPGFGYADYTYTWTTNPATTNSWTVDEVNGVGANALQGFGYIQTDANPDSRITQVYITVDYTCTPGTLSFTSGSSYSGNPIDICSDINLAGGASVTNVTITESGGGVPDVDPNGTYIEAENNTQIVNDPGATPALAVVDPGVTAGANGNAYVETSSGAGGNDPTGQRADYPVNFTTGGTYYFWVRLYDVAGGNSVFVGVDGVKVGGLTQTANGAWYWTNNVQTGTGANSTTITAGPHTLNIWGRENTLTDGIYITTTAGTPPGLGGGAGQYTGTMPTGATVIDPTNTGTTIYDGASCSGIDTTGWSTGTKNVDVVADDGCGGTLNDSGTISYTSCNVGTATTLSRGTVTATSVQLNWTDLANESSYNIYQDGSLVTNVPAGTTTYTHSSLSSNTSYANYTVVGVGTGPCEGPASNAVSALTLPGSPGTPTFTSVTENTLTVNWTAPTGGADSYDVYRGGVLQGNVTSPTVTYDDSGLTGNTSYDYYIVAKNTTGSGVLSGTGSQLTLPGKPGTPTFANVTSTSMTINWTAPTGGAASYDVYRDTVFIANVATNTYDDSSLTLNTSYDYYVVPKNATGSGTQSDTASQTTLNCSENGTVEFKNNTFPDPITGSITLSSTDVTLGGGATDPEFSLDGVTYSTTNTLTYNPPAQFLGTQDFYLDAQGDCGRITPTTDPTTANVDTRTNGLEVLQATAVATGPTSIKITMPYLGDRDENATFEYQYDDGSGMTAWSGPVTDSPDFTSPKEFLLTGLTADALVDINVRYADTGITDPNTYGTTQALQVQLVSWVDNKLLHNSNRFACSEQGFYSNETECNDAGGTWTYDRKWTVAGNEGEWGTNGTNDNYGPIMCATCHEKASGNIKRITTGVAASKNNFPGEGETISAQVADPDTNTSDYGDDSVGGRTLGANRSNRICEVCHSQNKYHNYDSANNITNGGDLTHQNAKDCISCHNHEGGFRASCSACHGNPPVDAGTLVTTKPTDSATAGAHDAHVNTQGIDCARCHNGSVGAGVTHDSDGTVTISFANLPTGVGGANGGSYSGQDVNGGAAPPPVDYDTTDGGVTTVPGTNDGTMTCANYCHGSTINNPADPTWTGAVSCGDCHGDQTNTNVNTLPSGTSHNTHVNTLGRTCDDCHGTGYGGTGHVDGVVVYNVTSLPNTGSTATYSGSTTGDSGGLAPSTGSYGSCDNVSCHFGNTTPPWNGGPLTCTSCHNNGTNDGSLENAAPNSGSHSDHVGANDAYVTCDNCHGAGATTASHTGHANNATNFAGDLIPGTNFTDVGGRANTNDTCAVICHQAATWGGSAGAGDITWTTETTNCDGVAVGDPVTNYCLDCHSATYSGLAGPTIVPAGGWASGSHLNAKLADETMSCRAEERNHCLECHVMHDGTQSTDAVWIPNPDTAERRAALGLDYSGAKHYNSVNLRKAAAGFTAQSTEAEICWTCHDSTRNGASVQSEWGVNNNATTGGLSYDYGSLSGSNWTTATWYSGKGAASGEPFWYKRGAIQSTHSVNWADGSSVVSGGDYNNTESPDLVTEIRCTYCHDVHNTFAATSHADESGQPYLRGRWKGNPYPEDGAPQSGMVDWTLSTGDGAGYEDYGLVPRGSASSTNTGDAAWPQTGGWWIDQNSGNPNSGETQASTAGLCLLCHTKDSAGTVVTIDTMDYEPGENLWVSNSGTGNGHMNAVLGGSGTTNLAYNIFTTPERGSSTIRSGDRLSPNPYVDMGGYSEGTDRLESFRGTADSAYDYTPFTGREGNGDPAGYRAHAFYHFEWGVSYSGSTSRVAAGTMDLVVDGGSCSDGTPDCGPPAAETQQQFHTFNCGKCHNPHASRLPKLMITNCLDTKQNTWDDAYTPTPAGEIPSPWTDTTPSQWPSAQNCHRLSDGTQSDTTRARGDGWNKVTPW